MKKNLPILIIGVLLTACCLSIYIVHPPFVQRVSLVANDILSRRIAVEPPRSGRVVVVDIDEKSLMNEEYGQWPWPRFLIADLTSRMLEGGASVVAFDIVFAEADRTSPVVLQNAIERRFQVSAEMSGLPSEFSDFDRLFAGELAKGNTVVGCYMHGQKTTISGEGRPDPCPKNYNFIIFRTDDPEGHQGKQFMLSAGDITLSLPVLNNAAARSGFFNTVPDLDNIVRACPLIWGYGKGRTYASLGLAAVCLDRGVNQVIVQHDRNGVSFIRIRDILIPTDSAGRLLVNYRRVIESTPGSGEWHSFPIYSAGDILAGDVDPSVFAGKIIFVGTSAAGLRDLRATPIVGEFPGVEIHATIVDNILSGDMLRYPTVMRAVDMAVILVTGLMLTFIVAKGRSWLSFLVTVLLAVAAATVSYYLLFFFHLVFVPAWVVLSILIIYTILTMLKFWSEESQKRQVRRMFGTMVSQEVLDYLESNPGSFTLSGEKRDATMFFSDVAGFTSISENLDPGQLSELLNRYLSPMTTIIMNRRGYVDKYEGDAIMAEWGVPFPIDDHAVQGCLAAIEQQETLDVLRPYLKKQFGYDIKVRMGLNSGRVTAGNMGSERRQQFTVMGDAVNQAARLEPVNKDYGTRMLIGETTYLQAKDAVEARLLDRIVVAGKTVPVQIYELLARKGELSPVRMDVVCLYEEALMAHWNREWDRALSRLRELMKIDPDDKPALLLEARIINLKNNPPPDTWTGELYRTSKD